MDSGDGKPRAKNRKKLTSSEDKDSSDGKPKKRTKLTEDAVPDFYKNAKDATFGALGYKFHKKFGNHGWFEGEVVKIHKEIGKQEYIEQGNSKPY